MGSKRKARLDFEQFYQSLYAERWATLREALLKTNNPIPFSNTLSCPYFLDEGSVIAADQLPVSDSDTVLDMCAAPGGKSLILASKLKERGLLVCNDRSSTRRNRLHTVLAEHLSKETMERIRVTSHDATRWALYERDQYDAILLDAPCSSERHVLQNSKALATWSPARTKHLAIQQFAMLASALEAVKIGGYVLYSTCSISPAENEEVIAKLEKRRAGRYEEIHTSVPFAERRHYGSIILPDTAEGRGPLYFCLLRRLA